MASLCRRTELLMFSGMSYKIASRSSKSSVGFNMVVGGDFYQPIWIAPRVCCLSSDGKPDFSFGSNSGFNNSGVNSVAIQSDGKIICGGSFNNYNGITRGRIARLNSDGTLDSSFSVGSGFNSTVNSVAIQSDGKIVCVGAFSSYNETTRGRIARLNSDGTLDSTFAVGIIGFNNTIFATAIKSDGKIVCVGAFTYLWFTEVSGIINLTSNGIPDSFLNSGSSGFGFNGAVFSLARQTDGKIICGGNFTTYVDTNSFGVARLNSNTDLDSTFDTGTGFNGDGSAVLDVVAIQSDGKIICTGSFSNYNGVSRDFIARLNPDGTLDSAFSLGSGFWMFSIFSVAIQSDEKIIIGGYFFLYDEANDFASSFAIARLNSDGTLDSSFSVGSGFISIAGNPYSIRSIAIQSDGKIICVGEFNNYNGTTTNCIARLNSDGTLDSTFSAGSGGSGFNNNVLSVAIQSDGKIICGGFFASYNGVARSCIVRLNSDGSLDSTFSVGDGFNGNVNSVAIQSDGKIICVGEFNSYNGVPRIFIARLNPDGTLDSNFAISFEGTGVAANTIILI